MTDAAFWDRIAPKYATDPISDQAAYAATLARMRHYLQPDQTVLEIGCGTGSTALELAPGVGRYIGTDISSEMIRLACAKLSPDASGNPEFKVAPADDLRGGPYDVILALNLLHLVPNMESVLARAHDTLPQGGLLITKTALVRDGKWYLSVVIPLMRAIGKAPYVHPMTQAEFLAALKRAGFEEVETIFQPGIAPRLFTVHRKI